MGMELRIHLLQSPVLWTRRRREVRRRGWHICKSVVVPGSASSYVLDAVAGDFNGDTAIDLAVLTDAQKLVIMLNDRRGALAPAFSYALPAPPSGSTSTALNVGELNGDGRPDLVLTYLGPNGTVTPYLATTGGAFNKGTSLTVGGTVSAGAAIADLNHDGHGDLALVTSVGTKIFWEAPALPLPSHRPWPTRDHSSLLPTSTKTA